MTASVPAQKSRILSARRLVLLASVAGLGVTVLLGGAGLLPQPTSPALTAIAYAQGVQRPMGFADIAELADGAVLPSLRLAGRSHPRGAARAAQPPRDRPGLRLLHHRRWLRGDE